MTKELRILILEDRPADAELVTRELRKEGIQFAAQRVMTEPDFLAQLREFAPDLILADYSLPSYDGLSALAAAQRERPEVPFIFVSGELGEETAIDALRLGATDYVLKQRLSRLGGGRFRKTKRKASVSGPRSASANSISSCAPSAPSISSSSRSATPAGCWRKPAKSSPGAVASCSPGLAWSNPAPNGWSPPPAPARARITSRRPS